MARAVLATGDEGGMVVLWDVSGDAPRRMRMLTNRPWRIDALAFSPDGQVLAVEACPATTPSSSQCEGEIQLWRLAL